jgi:hypothetical protein
MLGAQTDEAAMKIDSDRIDDAVLALLHLGLHDKCRAWDAAFDKGLVSFADDGQVLAKPDLSAELRQALALDDVPWLCGLRDAHRANLAAHRTRHGF